VPPLRDNAATLAQPIAREAHAAAKDAVLIIAALLALLVWDVAGLDLPLSRHFGNAAGFAWRDHWLMVHVMHDGVRFASWSVFALMLYNVWRPLPFALTVDRWQRIWWVATTLACAILISLLKRMSWTSCPWSLAEFGGGLAQHVSHWDFTRRDGGPGGCFPSGHASAAFSFLSGWYALRRHAPRAARAWLGVTVLVGVACGVGQTMRGAHYASHSMWTAWICWAVTALSYHLSRTARALTAR
jgi:membrane-associated PAP2 superfamily phosphatase